MSAPPRAPLDQALDVSTILRETGLSRCYVTTAIRRGRLRAIRSGAGPTSKYLVMRRWFEAFLEAEASASAGGHVLRDLRDLPRTRS